MNNFGDGIRRKNGEDPSTIFKKDEQPGHLLGHLKTACCPLRFRNSHLQPLGQQAVLRCPTPNSGNYQQGCRPPFSAICVFSTRIVTDPALA